MREWLHSHKIPAADNLLKVELLNLIKCNKPEKKISLACLDIHTVLRLPPYHCIFNPIEQIWGITKAYWRKGFGAKNAIKMWNKALETITLKLGQILFNTLIAK